MPPRSAPASINAAACLTVYWISPAAIAPRGGSAAYIAFVFLVVRPVATRLLARFDEVRLTNGIVAVVFAA
jgi:hypothetical protein